METRCETNYCSLTMKKKKERKKEKKASWDPSSIDSFRFNRTCIYGIHITHHHRNPHINDRRAVSCYTIIQNLSPT